MERESPANLRLTLRYHSTHRVRIPEDIRQLPQGASNRRTSPIIRYIIIITPPPQTLDATFISQARQINMTRNEYDFIEEVIDGSGAILSQVNPIPGHLPLPTSTSISTNK